ncbi:alpha/beta fold hydrolase [Candidatus Omnitrophota bacterium]
MLKLIFIILAFFILLPDVCAEPAQYIPLEVLFGNPEKARPGISPNGTLLSYLAPFEGVTNIWVKSLGASDDRVVTRDSTRGIWYYFWADDNRHIIYLQDADGDENWHLYSIDLETSVIRDLTPFLGAKAGVIATDNNFPDYVLVRLNTRDERIFDVYRVNLKTGAVIEEVRNPGDIVSWQTDNDFRIRLAYKAMPGGGTRLLLRKNGRSKFKEFITWPVDEYGGVLGFAPGSRYVYITDSRGTDTSRLYKMHVRTRRKKLIVFDEEVDIGPVMIHPTKHHLQAAGFVKEKLKWVVLDKKIKDDFETIQEISSGNVHIVSRDISDKKWIIGFVKDNAPVDYYFYNRETKSSSFLFSVRPKLKEYTLAKMQPVTITARDGLNMQCFLTLPTGREGNNLPLVLLVHGGPWSRDSWGYDAEVQWLANRGFAVLQVNFRGSSGFGKKFLNAGIQEWGRKMQDDLTDAVQWAIDEGFADKNRIAIFGASYGGYAALAGAAFTPDIYRCAVDAFGPSNLISFLNSIPPYWEPKRDMFRVRVGDVEEDEEMLKQRSPLFSVDKIEIPIFIVQGANDVRVKKEESEQIVEALEKKGIEVEYLVFSDEGHGFMKPQNRLRYYSLVETFLKKHLLVDH